MKPKAVCVLLLPAVAAAGYLAWPKPAAQPAASAAVPGTQTPGFRNAAPSLAAVAAAPAEVIELHTAVEQRSIVASFRGNGREKMRGTLQNTGSAALKIQAEAGQMLEAGSNAVVIIRPTSVEIAPGATAELPLQTVAARSTNEVSDAAYALSYNRAGRLAPLIDFAHAHPELSSAALQTAALALTENLPLSAVAKFTPASGELKSRFNTDAFRVETGDIIAALSALRELGLPDSSITMTVDAQLRIEAMIEPLSRAAAMRYYGITAETEWDFWKNELLSGSPTTRHYALYGIARFYPEVALEMLPKWARETKTNPVYRLSAVQALADTQRPEAVPILRQLSEELGVESELGRAALGAANHLNQRLTNATARQTIVAFRASKALGQN